LSGGILVSAGKWIVVFILAIAGVGGLGFGILESKASVASPSRGPLAVNLRSMSAAAAATPAPGAVKQEAPKAAEAKAQPAIEPSTPAAKPEVKKPEASKPEASKPEAPKPDKPKAAEAQPAKPVAEGQVNFRASDTADVFVDGKKLGGTPLLGVKVKVGNHKVRFDCYDAAGNAAPGSVMVVTVDADSEQDVDFDCPAE
jgi:hypothetical protein